MTTRWECLIVAIYYHLRVVVLFNFKSHFLNRQKCTKIMDLTLTLVDLCPHLNPIKDIYRSMVQSSRGENVNTET